MNTVMASLSTRISLARPLLIPVAAVAALLTAVAVSIILADIAAESGPTIAIAARDIPFNTNGGGIHKLPWIDQIAPHVNTTVHQRQRSYGAGFACEPVGLLDQIWSQIV